MDTQVGSKSSIGLTVQAQATMLGREHPADHDTFFQRGADLAQDGDRFRRQIDSHERSGFYTRQGLIKPITDECVAYLAGLRAFRKQNIDPLAREEQQLLAAASQPTPTAPEDKVLRFLRHEAILRRFEQIADPVERQLAVTKAADRGDRQYVDAVAEANPRWNLVPAEVLAKARQRMAAQASPELLRIQALRGAYEAVLAVAAKEVRDVMTGFGIELDGQPSK